MKHPKLIEMVKVCPMKLSEQLPNKHMPAITMSKHEKQAADEHISSLLKKKAVHCTKSNNNFISSVFFIPKKDGLSHDLKPKRVQ